MTGKSIHFLALTGLTLALVVFGRALAALDITVSVPAFLMNFVSIYSVSAALSIILIWLVRLGWKSKQIDLQAGLKNCLLVASSCLSFFYGFAIYRWNWPYNQQRGQPMYYENSWLTFFVGVSLIIFSVALWIFWRRKLSKSE